MTNILQNHYRIPFFICFAFADESSSEDMSSLATSFGTLGGTGSSPHVHDQ